MENNFNFWLNESHMNALANTTILYPCLFFESCLSESVHFKTLDKLACIMWLRVIDEINEIEILR